MEHKEVIALAKRYVADVYEDEAITNLGLEEVAFDERLKRWNIRLAFSRPWHTPRTRAQELLESMGSISSLKRTSKIVTIAEDGTIISMKRPEDD